MDKQLVTVSMGMKKADLAVVNGKIVNVYSKEVYDGGVAVSNGKIAAVGDIKYCIGEDTKIIDAKGKYLLPGFIDGHIHPESTNLSIRSFAEIVLTHGTTAVMADMHEVGVVGGLEAIEAVLDEAQATDLKIYFVVPSHVPFAPGLETSGGFFNSEIIKKALSRRDAVGLSEIVAPYLLQGNAELIKAMEIASSMGKSLQGHLPEMKGPAMNACMSAGVSTDHESLSTEDAIERLRAGCHLMMREGSAARNMTECLKAITEHKLDSTMCSIVTDDLHTVDAVERGHLDDAVRTALKNGIDFVTAVQMVTVNAARAFNLDREIGALAPGRRADIIISEGPEDFKVLSVISGGNLVVEDSKLIKCYDKVEHKACLLNTIKLSKKITAEDLMIKVDKEAKEAKVKVMRTLDWIPITFGQEAILPVKDGVVECDLEQDILYIAQVERHGKNGNIGKAFMGGFNLKSGAIASSVGHDNHNIIVLGTNFEDMALAVNRIADIQGGQVLVNNGEVICEVEYPILGLLSDLDAWELASQKKILNSKIHELGCTISIPFMFLSFICLAAIPEYAVTDYGFIDVMQQKIINPVFELIK
ncbi:adenine deaminase C-terminal domain-containing protein [Proteiniborus sp. MB09-C3]|uniref:adenine deaminase n=1 Tax=Proteiniborus sp. MB09-C3 TaxID=3050072 RepID=UPI002553DC94|nr:adenine deaminase C-terminal domain-containing protein [Proteiniborus sp. MB09-C3]WIV12147.1 adenine deaminase C-terminal domain-containing protein [Proteiniborus sp. MB09-C3]